MRFFGLMVGFVTLALAFRSPVPGVALDPVSRAALQCGLEVQGVAESELGFFKQWAPDSLFRLKDVDRMLDCPLEVVAYIESTAAMVGRFEPVALLGYQWARTDVGLTAADTVQLVRQVKAAIRPFSGSEELPENLAQAVQTLLAGFAVGKKHLEAAVAKLTPVELDRFLGEAPDFWKDEDDTLEKPLSGALHAEFGRWYDTSQDVKSETLLAYSRKLDRKALALSGLAVALAAAEAERLLRLRPIRFRQDVMGSNVDGIDGPVQLDLATEFGRVVVGGTADNVYRTECTVIIELSGDDRYMNRAGGAVGILGQPFSAVIDLEGNDCYFSDKLFSQGAALFGTGILIDCRGDDVYRSRHYGQGAAIFGTGLLWDRDGADCYRAGFFAQGAADFGVGLLVDSGGNDSYRSSCYCQGFSSTWACGILADHAGNDVYAAGGEYVHAPLLPHEYRSFSHGFSIGRRPDAAGGIALLYDRSGNDFYNGEVFCQGTSYWYALGMLWDGAGFDKYSAAQYSQGAGIHLAVGVLVDEDGCDAYVSRLGPSQGEGHDLSVGVLVDRKGDDIYYSSGGQGIGLTNSVGLFLDQDGNDAYLCVDSLLSHGSGNTARGFGGMGLFLDLAGKDKYPQGNVARDRSGWTKGTYGSGLDLPRAATVIDEEPDVDTTDVGIDSLSQPIESLFKTASIWEVGNARKKVARARKQLIGQGRKALDYVFEKKADSKDGLESRAVEELVKAMPDTAKPYLFRALRDKRFQARQNAAYWLGQLKEKARDGVDSILGALRERRITPRRAVSALGDIGDSTVVPKILYLLRDSYEPSRIVTSEACGKLKSRAAIPALIRTLDDRLFTVRSAAELALVATGTPALESLLEALPQLRPRALGHALRAAGQLAAQLDTVEQRELRVRSRRALIARLAHPDPFVRLCVVEALGRMMDETLVRRMREAQAEETDEFVQAKFRTVLQDR